MGGQPPACAAREIPDFHRARFLPTGGEPPGWTDADAVKARRDRGHRRRSPCTERAVLAGAYNRAASDKVSRERLPPMALERGDHRRRAHVEHVNDTVASRSYQAASVRAVAHREQGLPAEPDLNGSTTPDDVPDPQ